MKFCKHSKGLTPYPVEYGILYLNCNECGVDFNPNVIPILERAEKAEARVKELESRLTLSYAIDLENKVRRLERIVEVAKMVNPLAPETIYKLIEELER